MALAERLHEQTMDFNGYITEPSGYGGQLDLLSRLSSHVMGMTDRKQLSEDLVRYAVSSMGFDVAGIYMVRSTEQNEDTGQMDLISYFPQDTSLFKASIQYNEVKSLFDRRGSDKHNLTERSISIGMSSGYSLTYCAVFGLQSFGGMMVLAKSGHKDISDIETVQIQAMCATLSGVVKREQAIEQTHRSNSIDALTGAYNRRYLEFRFASDLADAEKTGNSIAVVFADIDNMKYINDTFGHAVGDKVLKEFAESVRSSIRACDYLVRYGGDEFVLILSDTDQNGAKCVVDRIKRTLAHKYIKAGSSRVIFPTSSFGVSIAPSDGATVDQILCISDKRMYEAKGKHKRLSNIMSL